MQGLSTYLEQTLFSSQIEIALWFSGFLDGGGQRTEPWGANYVGLLGMGLNWDFTFNRSRWVDELSLFREAHQKNKKEFKTTISWPRTKCIVHLVETPAIWYFGTFHIIRRQ